MTAATPPSLTSGEIAAQAIVDHQPNKHDWGYTQEVLLVARAYLDLLSSLKGSAGKGPETWAENRKPLPSMSEGEGAAADGGALAFGRALHLLDKHARKYPEVYAFLLQHKFKRHCR